jgi:hypothetical protein
VTPIFTERETRDSSCKYCPKLAPVRVMEMPPVVGPFLGDTEQITGASVVNTWVSCAARIPPVTSKPSVLLKLAAVLQVIEVQDTHREAVEAVPPIRAAGEASTTSRFTPLRVSDTAPVAGPLGRGNMDINTGPSKVSARERVWIAIIDRSKPPPACKAAKIKEAGGGGWTLIHDSAVMTTPTVRANRTRGSLVTRAELAAHKVLSAAVAPPRLALALPSAAGPSPMEPSKVTKARPVVTELETTMELNVPVS